MPPKLTARQRAFVAAYAGNATQAAIAAGYSPKTAESAGSRLLRNVKVAEAVAIRETSRNDKAIATREQRQAFWTETMRAKDVELQHRLKASELLGKSEADFVDRVEHSGKVTLAELLAEADSGKA